jgi:hypothetical protein
MEDNNSIQWGEDLSLYSVLFWNPSINRSSWKAIFDIVPRTALSLFFSFRAYNNSERVYKDVPQDRRIGEENDLARCVEELFPCQTIREYCKDIVHVT